MSDQHQPVYTTPTRRSFLAAAAAFSAGATYGGGGARLNDVDYSKVIADLQKLISEKLARDKVKCMSIALVDGTRTVWSAGFGFTDEAKTKPVTADTLF